jgi:hypothetical protein
MLFFLKGGKRLLTYFGDAEIRGRATNERQRHRIANNPSTCGTQNRMLLCLFVLLKLPPNVGPEFFEHHRHRVVSHLAPPHT